KVQAHLSAFSAPAESNQAFRSGSVTASSSSWEMIEAMPSAPALPFGALPTIPSQELGQRSGLPTNEYLMSTPPFEPWVCQPQYAEQKPELSEPSEELKTK